MDTNSSSDRRQLYNAAMSHEVSTAGRTGRFSRINPEHPERHSGYPVENRSYSPGAFPENMSIYEKGSGAEYMAAAGWSGNSMGAGDTSSKPTAYPTTFGSNSNGKNRCLIVAVIVLLLLLILLAIAVGVLFATKVFVLNTQKTDATNATQGTSSRSSDAVGAATTVQSSQTSTIATTTTLRNPSTTSPLGIVENRAFSCSIVILNQANDNYNNRASDDYILAARDITNILTTVFKTSYLATSFNSIQVDSIRNQ